MLWRRIRALAAAAFEAACLPGHGQLVVVDDTVPDAYALPGLPGRVVVSTGMLDALNDADRKAMLAHERAHLACHHYAFVAAAHLAAACNPLLRPAAARRLHRGALGGRARRDHVRRPPPGRPRGGQGRPGHDPPPRPPTGPRGRPRTARTPPFRTARRRSRATPRRRPARRAARRLPAAELPHPASAAAAAVVGASALCAFAAAHDLHVVLKLACAG